MAAGIGSLACELPHNDYRECIGGVEQGLLAVMRKADLAPVVAGRLVSCDYRDCMKGVELGLLAVMRKADLAPVVCACNAALCGLLPSLLV